MIENGVIRKRNLQHIDVEEKPSFDSGIGFQPVNMR